MKNIKKIFLTGLTIALITGCSCSEEKTETDTVVKFESLEIEKLPKTTFYCGENFSNNGIVLKVNFSDGSSYTTEDVTTSSPSSMMRPGKQTIKAYYSNSEKDINSYVTYEINLIDWTMEEKAIFGQTSISSLSGIYYPKMDGMKLVTEEDEEGNIDYWIELENANESVMNNYLDLLDEYLVQRTAVQDGEQYVLTYRFYEQTRVPADFIDLYGDELEDMICFKYCASYEYIDTTYGTISEVYGSELEDTLVVGLDKDNKLIVRYIADRILLETMFGYEVNQRFQLNKLLYGTVYTGLRQSILGAEDAESGKHLLGLLDTLDPLAVDYFIMPDISLEVFSIEDICPLNPWVHGEDILSFEVLITATEEEYNDYLSTLNAKDSFVKTTREEVYGPNTYTYSVYTIENKEYVGDIEIAVSNYLPDKVKYTIVSTGEAKSVGCYYVSFSIRAPEVLSPAISEACRIYDIFYGEGNYSKDNIQAYYKGAVDGSVKFTQFKETATHTTKGENEVENMQEAAEKFVAKALNDYTVKEALHEVTMGGTKVISGTYENDNYIVTIASYFSGNGRFTVEFSIEIKA